jgi:hypothetical protein
MSPEAIRTSSSSHNYECQFVAISCHDHDGDWFHKIGFLGLVDWSEFYQATYSSHGLAKAAMQTLQPAPARRPGSVCFATAHRVIEPSNSRVYRLWNVKFLHHAYGLLRSFVAVICGCLT